MHAVTSEIYPFQEVRYFVATNTEHDAQNLRAFDLVRKGGIEAGSALLDRTEVKGCGIGKRLRPSRWREVCVGSRDGLKLAIGKRWKRLNKSSAGVEFHGAIG